jgi:hypothetical protein
MSREAGELILHTITGLISITFLWIVGKYLFLPWLRKLFGRR